MKHTLIWRRDESDNQTLEVLQLEESVAFIKAESTICGKVHDNPVAIRYSIDIDKNWYLRKVNIKSLLDDSKSLCLYSDTLGNWKTESGQTIDELQGCYDVDISLTPFTNSFPVKRLGDGLRHRTHLSVVYIDLSQWAFNKASQFYTKKSDNTYLYEGVFRNFSANLLFDDLGFISEYLGSVLFLALLFWDF